MGSEQGQIEISAALSEVRGLIRAAILFSVFVNLLMLTSPLFMLQVYDRVLNSHSEETLAALVLLMTLLFGIMVALDFARAQLMVRVAARVQARLEPRVFAAAMQSPQGAPESRAADQRNLGGDHAYAREGDQQPYPDRFCDDMSKGKAEDAPPRSQGPAAQTSDRRHDGSANLGGPYFGHTAQPRITPKAQPDGLAKDSASAIHQSQPESRTDPLSDLDSMTRFLASPGFLALTDLPWLPIFLAATALFHPSLGLLALAGGAVLILVTVLNQRGTGAGLARMASEAQAADTLARRLHTESELVQALGMRDAAKARWQLHRMRQSAATVRTADSAALWSTIGRGFRQYLQSAVLALAALLVLRGEVTAGAMIAASILTGRALAPIDQLLAHWPLLLRARAARRALATLLAERPAPAKRMELPRPSAHLLLNHLTVHLPGNARPSLNCISAEIFPGQALAVIGASGSGKTTLARALSGTLPLAPRMALLGGAPLAAYGDDLGRLIGYLPQRVTLFDGTIAENIARLDPAPSPAQVIAAAQMAGIHQAILSLPLGYETMLTAQAPQLSGGQVQRLGLARALYGGPLVVVLDEPDSNLDHDGSEALSRAVRQLKADGKIVIIMAHRPAAIRECDVMLVLDAGERRGFGPSADLLRAMVRQMPNEPPSQQPPPPEPAQSGGHTPAASQQAGRVFRVSGQPQSPVEVSLLRTETAQP